MKKTGFVVSINYVPVGERSFVFSPDEFSKRTPPTADALLKRDFPAPNQKDQIDVYTTKDAAFAVAKKGGAKILRKDNGVGAGEHAPIGRIVDLYLAPLVFKVEYDEGEFSALGDDPNITQVAISKNAILRIVSAEYEMNGEKHTIEINKQFNGENIPKQPSDDEKYVAQLTSVRPATHAATIGKHGGNPAVNPPPENERNAAAAAPTVPPAASRKPS